MASSVSPNSSVSQGISEPESTIEVPKEPGVFLDELLGKGLSGAEACDLLRAYYAAFNRPKVKSVPRRRRRSSRGSRSNSSASSRSSSEPTLPESFVAEWNGEWRAGLIKQTGYCYLNAVKKVAGVEKFGSYPTVGYVLSSAASYWDLNALRNLKIRRSSAGIYHLSLNGYSAYHALAGVAAEYQFWQPGSLGAELLTNVRPHDLDGVIKLTDVIGGDTKIEGVFSANFRRGSGCDFRGASEHASNPQVNKDTAVATCVNGSSSKPGRSVAFGSAPSDSDSNDTAEEVRLKQFAETLQRQGLIAKIPGVLIVFPFSSQQLQGKVLHIEAPSSTVRVDSGCDALHFTLDRQGIFAVVRANLIHGYESYSNSVVLAVRAVDRQVKLRLSNRSVSALIVFGCEPVAKTFAWDEDRMLRLYSDKSVVGSCQFKKGSDQDPSVCVRDGVGDQRRIWFEKHKLQLNSDSAIWRVPASEHPVVIKLESIKDQVEASLDSHLIRKGESVGVFGGESSYVQFSSTGVIGTVVVKVIGMCDAYSMDDGGPSDSEGMSDISGGLTLAGVQ